MPAFPEDVLSPIKKLSNEDKELEAALENAWLAQGSPVQGGRMEGGVFKGLGTAAITFEAHDESWDFLPTPTEAARAAFDEVVKPIAATHPPSTIVAYISADPQIKKKHDIVKASAYAPYALTYVAAYNCNLKAFVKPSTWVRDEKTDRLKRGVQQFPGGRSGLIDEVIDSIAGRAGQADNIPCLLIPKFEKTVTDMPVGDAVKAIIEILKGLCVDRNFIIDDLHLDNMAVMPDGKAVTFDYDKVRTFDKFGDLFKEILESPYMYLQLPHYQHVMKLGPNTLQMFAVKPNLAASRRFFVNYDLLSVLSSLKFICSGIYETARDVDTCMGEIGAAADYAARLAAVEKLGGALRVINGGANALEYIIDFQSSPELHATWKTWIDRPAERERPRRGLIKPYGGRRTPRRKGLPQLL